MTDLHALFAAFVRDPAQQHRLMTLIGAAVRAHTDALLHVLPESGGAEAERDRDELIAILFPPLEQAKGGWWHDHGVREIDGAIYDIERAQGRCDEICMNTLKRVAEKLGKAQKLAEPYRARRPWQGAINPEDDGA